MALTDWLPWRGARAQGEPSVPLALPGGAPLGRVYGVAKNARTSDPLEYEQNVGQVLVTALRSADCGQTASLQAVYDSMLVRDGRLAGLARTRILAITSRRWAVRPPAGYEQDREALRVAQDVTTAFYETPAFARRRAELAQGILRGVGLLEHDWSLDRRGWRVSRPRYIDPSRVVVDACGQWSKQDIGDTKPIPLSEWPDKFVIHSPSSGLALSPQRRGALRPLLPLALAKRFGLRWWLEMLERFGQPQVYGRALDPNASASFLDELADGLRKLSADWAAAFRGNVELSALPVSINDEAHLKFCDFVNTEMAVNLLGGNLTTQVSDSQTFGSQAQDRVRGDLLAADLVELDETITDQWIAPMVRFNAPGAPCPVIETVVTASRPWSVAEYQAGLCTLDEYRTSNGQDALGDARGQAFAAPQLPPAYAGASLSIPASAAPPGGAVAEVPFPRSMTASGPTSPTSTHPLARLLSQS